MLCGEEMEDYSSSGLPLLRGLHLQSTFHARLCCAALLVHALAAPVPDRLQEHAGSLMRALCPAARSGMLAKDTICAGAALPGGLAV